MPHTNRLVHETSPYLQQHAHNPVDWYPWGMEALDRARRENKPILLSIGYSACHWCHVMERESFENDAIARLMNENFVSIKVDREERPDLDQIYQTVCQMLTGQGGWPLTMFLTPDLKPFWGGTYFPPQDRYGRPGFGKILAAIADHYHQNPESVQSATREIDGALKSLNRAEAGAGDPPADLLSQSAARLARAFDPVHGGLGSAPKFPNTMSLEIFLRNWNQTGNQEDLERVTHTLGQMASGGIYDQLGGGFHRYSVDAYWLVPHFEKMLYDNALLSRLLVDTFAATGDPFFERVLRETLNYVLREMTSPEGGFYSTQDADSEGEEGKFYVWTQAEVDGILGPEAAELFCEAYDVTSSGNFEHGASILHLAVAPERLADRRSMPVEELKRQLRECRQKLFQVRESRVKPFRDEKILTSWNGLMIGALAAAGRTLGAPEYTAAAARAARFVRDSLFLDGKLIRTIREGVTRGEGFLDDYGFMIVGLIELFQADPRSEWISWATELMEIARERFRDPESGDFFLTQPDDTSLIVRPRQNHDQSIPSGVSTAAFGLLYLSAVLERPDLREEATQVFRANAAEMEDNPHGLGNLICAFDLYQRGPEQLVIRMADGPENLERLSALRGSYRPNSIVVAIGPDESPAPLTEGKPLFGQMTAFVCKNFTCSRPLRSWDELAGVVERRS